MNSDQEIHLIESVPEFPSVAWVSGCSSSYGVCLTCCRTMKSTLGK
jgi:hypothetical protein